MIKQLYVEANASVASRARRGSNEVDQQPNGAPKRPTILVKGGRRLESLDELEEALELEAVAEETLDGYGYFEFGPAEETRRDRHKRIGRSLSSFPVALLVRGELTLASFLDCFRTGIALPTPEY